VLRAVVLVFAACVAVGCGPGESRDGADAGATRTLATGLQVPWGIAFLPGGDALVSERTTGRIWRISRDGSPKQTVMRVPGVDTESGEGGLLGLALSPSYPSDGLVYAYVTSDTDNRIVRFRLGGGLDPILTGIRRGDIHDGGRIAFGPDGKLYASVGEAADGELAQDPGSLNGKILRMNADGSVPLDNPFAGSLVWTLGHRNVEGFAWDSSGRLWATEFGQDEFDELNLIRSGRNYGWPEVEGPAPRTVGASRTRSSPGRPRKPRRAARRSETASSTSARFRARRYCASSQRPACAEAQPAAAGGLRTHPHGRARPRRLAVGSHLEPRRTGQSGTRR
jgi:glucose/arabinose dehydrogenase